MISNSLFTEEMEVLQAIYMDELIICEQNEKFVELKINIHPNTADDEDGKYVCMTLHFQFIFSVLLSNSYPYKEPIIIIKNPRGLSDSHLASIEENLKSLAMSMIGDSMVFSLIEYAKESLTDNNHPSCCCPICLDKFEESDPFFRTACYHYFHVTCIKGYIKVAETLICPVCRKDFDIDATILEYAPDFNEAVAETEFEADAWYMEWRKKCEVLFERQRKNGGIIDLEFERNKYLITLSDVPARNEEILVSTDVDKESLAIIDNNDIDCNIKVPKLPLLNASDNLNAGHIAKELKNCHISDNHSFLSNPMLLENDGRDEAISTYFKTAGDKKENERTVNTNAKRDIMSENYGTSKCSNTYAKSSGYKQRNDYNGHGKSSGYKQRSEPNGHGKFSEYKQRNDFNAHDKSSAYKQRNYSNTRDKSSAYKQRNDSTTRGKTSEYNQRNASNSYGKSSEYKQRNDYKACGKPSEYNQRNDCSKNRRRRKDHSKDENEKVHANYRDSRKQASDVLPESKLVDIEQEEESKSSAKLSEGLVEKQSAPELDGADVIVDHTVTQCRKAYKTRHRNNKQKGYDKGRKYEKDTIKEEGSDTDSPRYSNKETHSFHPLRDGRCDCAPSGVLRLENDNPLSNDDAYTSESNYSTRNTYNDTSSRSYVTNSEDLDKRDGNSQSYQTHSPKKCGLANSKNRIFHSEYPSQFDINDVDNVKDSGMSPSSCEEALGITGILDTQKGLREFRRDRNNCNASTMPEVSVLSNYVSNDKLHFGKPPPGFSCIEKRNGKDEQDYNGPSAGRKPRYRQPPGNKKVDKNNGSSHDIRKQPENQLHNRRPGLNEKHKDDNLVRDSGQQRLLNLDKESMMGGLERRKIKPPPGLVKAESGFSNNSCRVPPGF